MRIFAIALAVCLAGCAAPPPTSTARASEELVGRTAGMPQRCVLIVGAEALRAADADTIVYGHGRTIWVNRPLKQCGGFSTADILITEPIGSYYCRGDLVRSIDPVSRIPGAGCILGDFVPYTR